MQLMITPRVISENSLKIVRLLIYCLFIIRSAPESCRSLVQSPLLAEQRGPDLRKRRKSNFHPRRLVSVWENDSPTHTLLTAQSNNSDRWAL